MSVNMSVMMGLWLSVLMLRDEGVGEFMYMGDESVIGCDVDLNRFGVVVVLWCSVLLFTYE